MNYDEKAIDDATLALMYLVSETHGPSVRAWKGFDWDTLKRLHQAGFISNPVGKARSVYLSQEGAERSRTLFRKMFAAETGSKE